MCRSFLLGDFGVLEHGRERVQRCCPLAGLRHRGNAMKALAKKKENEKRKRERKLKNE